MPLSLLSTEGNSETSLPAVSLWAAQPSCPHGVVVISIQAWVS